MCYMASTVSTYLREPDPLMYRAAFLAQMVERWPFKPMVVGSIPTEGAFFIFSLMVFVCVQHPTLSLFPSITVVRARLLNFTFLDGCDHMLKVCGRTGSRT